jgi:hypothetical protein
MTDEQKRWLAEHPEYSPVRRHGAVSLYDWLDEGTLFPNGHFAKHNSTTLILGNRGSVVVGRRYEKV